MAKDTARDVTVLVFKDNYAARSFQIPLQWISKMGFFLWLTLGITLVSSFLVVKYYRIARRADTGRVQNLENELSDLKASYHALESRSLEPKTTSNAPTADGATQNGPDAAAATGTNPVPVPTVTVTVSAQTAPVPTVTVTAPPAPSSGSVSASAGARPLLFTALPSNVTQSPPDPKTLAITVNALKASWSGSGKTLRVNFNIQYVRKDGGTQQGRIVVLTRGPDSFLSYPNGTLSSSGSEFLINPSAGEYFSVGRYREVRAEFPFSRAGATVKAAEVLIFSQTGQILIHQQVGVSLPSPSERSSDAASSQRGTSPQPQSSSAPDLNAPPAPPEGNQ